MKLNMFLFSILSWFYLLRESTGTQSVAISFTDYNYDISEGINNVECRRSCQFYIKYCVNKTIKICNNSSTIDLSDNIAEGGYEFELTDTLSFTANKNDKFQITADIFLNDNTPFDRLSAEVTVGVDSYLRLYNLNGNGTDDNRAVGADVKAVELCKPRNDATGHYECDENGNKVCLPGWENVTTNCATVNVTAHSSSSVTKSSVYSTFRNILPSTSVLAAVTATASPTSLLMISSTFPVTSSSSSSSSLETSSSSLPVTSSSIKVKSSSIPNYIDVHSTPVLVKIQPSSRITTLTASLSTPTTLDISSSGIISSLPFISTPILRLTPSSFASSLPTTILSSSSVNSLLESSSPSKLFQMTSIYIQPLSTILSSTVSTEITTSIMNSNCTNSSTLLVESTRTTIIPSETILPPDQEESTIIISSYTTSYTVSYTTIADTSTNVHHATYNTQGDVSRTTDKLTSSGTFISHTDIGFKISSSTISSSENIVAQASIIPPAIATLSLSSFLEKNYLLLSIALASAVVIIFLLICLCCQRRKNKKKLKEFERQLEKLETIIELAKEKDNIIMSTTFSNGESAFKFDSKNKEFMNIDSSGFYGFQNEVFSPDDDPFS